MTNKKIRYNRMLILFLILLLLVNIPIVFGGDWVIEDLTSGYVESDASNRIVFNETQVNITNMERGDNNIYLYKDFVDPVTDFKLRFDFKTPTTGISQSYFRGGLAGWSNSLADINGASPLICAGFYVSGDGGAGYPPRLLFWNDTVGNTTSSGTNLAENTWYYCNFNRTGSTIVYEIYTDAERTSLKTSHTVTGVITTGFRYFYVAQSCDDGIQDTAKATYYTRNYAFLTVTAPTNPQVTYTPSATTINLTWTKGYNANNTVIVMNTSGYPSSVTDGEIWYNGTDTWYENSSISTSTHYYIRGWSEYYWSGPDDFERSSSYTDFPYGGITINVYDENTTSAISGWGVEISKKDKTPPTYENKSATNPLIIPIDDLPYGVDTSLKFNATGYNSRLYYMDLLRNNEYTLNVFLPPSNITESYVLRVLDDISNPVKDAKVQIKRYINSTIGWENISILLTSPTGYCSVDLVPYVHYGVTITKTGYETETSNLHPIPIVFGDERYHTFQITQVSTEYEHPLENITYSLEPIGRNHNQSISFFYNISSLNNDIESFRITIFYYDADNLTWVQLHTEMSTSNGGSLNYITNNVPGMYGIKLEFDRIGWSNYIFGGEYDYMYLYNIFHNASFTPIINDPDNINTIINNAGGGSPVYLDATTVVTWTALGASLVITMFLFTFSSSLGGFGIMIVAVILGAMKMPLNLLSEADISTTSVVLIFLLGLLTLIITKKKD